MQGFQMRERSYEAQELDMVVKIEVLHAQLLQAGERKNSSNGRRDNENGVFEETINEPCRIKLVDMQRLDVWKTTHDLAHQIVTGACPSVA